MSMTREEAIRLLKQYQGYESMFPDGEKLKHAFDLTDETVDTLLTALRPVSREQVEEVWRGCEKCNGAGEYSRYAENLTKILLAKYCPHCGRPLTDEAVEMEMERLEALKDAGD